MAQAIVCDRKGEIAGDGRNRSGEMSLTLTDSHGVVLVKAEGLDLCDSCVEMCYKIITSRLLPRLLDKEEEAEGA